MTASVPMKATLFILGASGDLARRLLLPALYRLDATSRLPDLSIVGYAIEEWSADHFRDHVHENLVRFEGSVSGEVWKRFARRLDYRSGTLDPGALRKLGALAPGPALFYLALPPDLFPEAARALGRAGLAEEKASWRRLVVEKPLGRDLPSSLQLEQAIHEGWREEQVFRIDHFLGKETVQNLLVFRFANRFLEPVLNSQNITQVQVTAAETIGLEGRYRYYDGIGALRDMIQNHLMQLFTLTAMEPPSLWDADVLRDHKVEVLKAVRPIPEDDVDRHAVRGRYTRGRIGAEETPGYLEEPHIAGDSRTETFAAIRLEVDTWRWKGVPFYLRSGKRLTSNLTEIALEFREPPTRLFRRTRLEQVDPNWLVFRLRPDETVELSAQAKKPGLDLESRPVVLRASYTRDGEHEYSAYEQLLLDALQDEKTSFLRADEATWAWRILDPVLKAWQAGEPESYRSGTRGPESQDRILRRGHRWRPLDRIPAGNGGEPTPGAPVVAPGPASPASRTS